LSREDASEERPLSLSIKEAAALMEELNLL
jgi:hypothetical protein